MMANLSEDIQKNGENILQSINEGPFKMGKFRETLADGALGPERDRVVKDLIPEEKKRCSWKGRHNRLQGNNASGVVAAGNKGVITCKCTHPKRPQNSEYFKDKMLLMQAQENGVVLDEERLLFIAGGQDSTFDDDVDQVFEADQCDDFDSDVDEALTAQTMFMVNLSSTDLIYDEAGPSYDSEILSEVQDHDNYLDNVGEYHEVHEMQNDVQQNYVVDSYVEYTSDSNIILYE
ncbi:hypothetical protein Tco_0367928 [Tanacetum coccineum]